MELAILLTAIVLNFIQLDKVSSEDCPQLYKRFSSNHSYCRPRNEACEILTSYPTPGDINNIMNLHNSYRSSIATEKKSLEKGNLPSATNMLQMEWDEELAAVAQQYANLCIYEHDCSNCRRVGNFGVGQNMALQKWIGGYSRPQPDWKFAVSEWFSEIIYFNPNNICPFRPQVAGGEYRHFTQLVWAETFRVGCGYVLYKEKNASGDIVHVQLYICNYGPAGNVYEDCVYKAGPPCSNCPVNSCCGNSCDTDNRYPDLCQRIGDEAPYYRPPQNTLFYCDFRANPDCEYDILGSSNWRIEPSLSGNYLGVVLNGGEKTTVSFASKIKPISGHFCVSLKYRKGPNIDGEEEANTAIEIFKVQDLIYTQELPSFDNPTKQQFNTFDMSLSWSFETELTLSFAVPQGKPAQFFHVRSIIATDGIC